MFGISIPELLLVFAVILIVFGPKRLPELAKTFGKFFGKARHESDKLRREFYNTIYPPLDFTNKPESNKPESNKLESNKPEEEIE